MRKRDAIKQERTGRARELWQRGDARKKNKYREIAHSTGRNQQEKELIRDIQMETSGSYRSFVEQLA